MNPTIYAKCPTCDHIVEAKTYDERSAFAVRTLPTEIIQLHACCNIAELYEELSLVARLSFTTLFHGRT